MRKDIGHHHPFPPESIIEEETRYVDAGAVRIGVEVRRLDGLVDRLRSAYTGTPFETVFEQWWNDRRDAVDVTPTTTPATALGGGVSIHVLGAGDGHEYLRFDCLDGVPHYHYLRPWTDPRDCDNHEVDWDEVAHGPMLPWALDALRTRLPEMLIEAGGAEIATRLDPERLDAAVRRVADLVREAAPA